MATSSQGLPIFGTSNYTTPRWVPEPNSRGTWSLIQSCLLTLGLCVFSAIHPNVFHRESRWWTRWLVRFKWLVAALIAPEFIVFNAWSQRRHAARIARQLRRRAGQPEHGKRGPLSRWWHALTTRNKPAAASNVVADLGESGVTAAQPSTSVLGVTASSSGNGATQAGESKKAGVPTVTPEEVPSPDTTTSKKSEQFKLIHGFAIVMGCLAVDMSTDPERVWPKICNRLTITPACFEECFSRPAFTSIDLSFLTKDQISTRQKTDHLAKTLVLVQALWFCLQFAARLWQALPVSLLELNTFAHALCAVFIYVLWWHKPGVIEEQFVLRTEASEALRDICAAQWTSGASTDSLYEGQVLKHPDSGHHDHNVGQRHGYRHRPLRAFAWQPMFVHGGSDLAMTLARGRRNLTLCPGAGEDWYLFDRLDRWFYYPHLATLADGGPLLRVRAAGLAGDDDNKSSSTNPTYPASARRFVAGEAVLDSGMHVAPQFASLDVDAITLRRWARTFAHDDATYCRNYTVWLRDRQPNFAWPRGLDSTEGAQIGEELIKSLFMFLVTSLAYGGLHMLGWQASALPASGAPQVFWKLSCLLLMTVGPVSLAVWAGLKAWRGADAHLRLNQAMSIGFGLFGALMFAAYLVSRVYLVVEIVIVIPYMDPGVFHTPDFSRYWPHFG
ncbi:hypothetical protein B0T24DRAFT_592848 [Lasiosphaeria ovina]|uniref:Uncharacterized protein n=1 Tax=Lasiosphaeria ovina TaxID=92902 RepID=A0AAE0NC59_9PEZI|nr:hypothetical protein B0T24DRAFT_592848 [Lasiosphaeria ovina]